MRIRVQFAAQLIIILLSTTFLVNISRTPIDASEGQVGTVHVAPVAVAVLVLQTSATVLVDIAANFNETGVQLGLGNVTTDDMGQYVVEVESTRTAGPFPGSVNLTVSTTLGRPDVGNYTLYVVEPFLGKELAVRNFSVLPWRNILFSKEGVVASLKTYLDYNEAELKAVPPMLYNKTRFWVNSTSIFPMTLGIRVNATIDLYDVSLSLTPPQGVDFNLNPSNWTYGKIDKLSSAEGYFNLSSRDVPVGRYDIAYTLNYTDGNTWELHTEQSFIPFGVYTVNACWDAVSQTGITRSTSPFNDNQTSFFYNFTTLITVDGYELTTWQSYNSTTQYNNVTVRTNPIQWAIVGEAALAGAITGAVDGVAFEYFRLRMSGELQSITWLEAAKKMAWAGLKAAPFSAFMGAVAPLSAGMRPTPLGHYIIRRMARSAEFIDQGLSYLNLGMAADEQAIAERLRVQKMSAESEFVVRKVEPPEDTIRYVYGIIEESKGFETKLDPLPSSKWGSNVQLKLLPPTHDLTGEWTGTYVFMRKWTEGVPSLRLRERVEGAVDMLLSQHGNNLTGVMRTMGQTATGEDVAYNVAHFGVKALYLYWIRPREETVYGIISGSRIEPWGSYYLAPTVVTIPPYATEWWIDWYLNSSSGDVWGLAWLTERMQFKVTTGWEGGWSSEVLNYGEVSTGDVCTFEASLTRFMRFPLFIPQTIRGNATLSREGVNMTLAKLQEIGPRDYVILPDGVLGLIRPDGTVERWKNTITTFVGVEKLTTMNGTSLLCTIPPPPPPTWLKQKLRDEIKVDPMAVTLPVKPILTLSQWILNGTITQAQWVPLLISGSTYVLHPASELLQEPVLNSTIITPDAIITPRGTEYTVDVDMSGTRIRVLNGTVFVADNTYNRTIEARQEMFVPRTGGVQNATIKTFDLNSIDKWWLLAEEQPPPTEQPPTMPPTDPTFILRAIAVTVISATLISLIVVRIRRTRKPKPPLKPPSIRRS